MTVGIYFEDVDAVFKIALDAGAESIRTVQDQFDGDRSGQFRDPLGRVWSVATHVEDVSPNELARRSAEAKGG